MVYVVNLYIRFFISRTLFFWLVCFRNCIHSFFSIKKNDEEDRAIENTSQKTKNVLFLLLDMSNIKKFFSKMKSEVKFAKAGDGHRLNEPTSHRNIPVQPRPQTTTRQSSDGGVAARAAAEAAQQRLQQQTSWQQSTTSSKNTDIYF